MKLSDILKKDINSEEPIIKFIVNPNDYIYQQLSKIKSTSQQNSLKFVYL